MGGARTWWISSHGTTSSCQKKSGGDPRILIWCAMCEAHVPPLRIDEATMMSGKPTCCCGEEQGRAANVQRARMRARGLGIPLATRIPRMKSHRTLQRKASRPDRK